MCATLLYITPTTSNSLCLGHLHSIPTPHAITRCCCRCPCPVPVQVATAASSAPTLCRRFSTSAAGQYVNATPAELQLWHCYWQSKCTATGVMDPTSLYMYTKSLGSTSYNTCCCSAWVPPMPMHAMMHCSAFNYLTCNMPFPAVPSCILSGHNVSSNVMLCHAVPPCAVPCRSVWWGG
jgi:hypothetical protein